MVIVYRLMLLLLFFIDVVGCPNNQVCEQLIKPAELNKPLIV